MTLGNWKSYEELEMSLTINELFLLFSECINKDVRSLEISAKAFGAKIDINFGVEPNNQSVEQDSSAFENLLGRIGKGSNNKPEELKGLRGIGYIKDEPTGT